MLVDRHSARDLANVELGMRLGQDDDGGPTIRASKHGYGRNPPGVGATLAERRDYGQYLISGRGKPARCYPGYFSDN